MDKQVSPGSRGIRDDRKRERERERERKRGVAGARAQRRNNTAGYLRRERDATRARQGNVVALIETRCLIKLRRVADDRSIG